MSRGADDVLSEIQESFLSEAEDLLVTFESAVLAVQKGSDPMSATDELFRVAHNLKGSAAAVGFIELSKFAHKVESVLLRIKKHEITFTQNSIAFLLRCSDELIKCHKQLVADAKARIDVDERVVEGLHRASTCKLDGMPECLATCPGRLCVKHEHDHADHGDSHHEESSQIYALEAASDQTSGPEASGADGAHSPHDEKPKSGSNETIRVQTRKIENLLNDIGELVILQTVLTQNRLEMQSPLLRKTVLQMEKIIRSAQENSMALRMVPLGSLFMKLDRIVHDSSQALNKDVEIFFSGDHEELDKTMCERISDPLVHIVRNAVDHGLELPAERTAAGKPSKGTVNVSAFHRGSQFMVEVKDDGRGLDHERIKQKAIEKGLISAESQLSPQEAMQLIFKPGFSTKDEVTDLSGRGVGMDVVRRNIDAVHGRIEIDTEPGKGTCIRLLLPMSLAITDGVVVGVGDELFVIPRSQILEYHRPAEAEVHTMGGRSKFLMLREANIPLVELSDLVGQRRKVERGTEKKLRRTVVILESAKYERIGVFVDRIIRQQQVVIKQLSKESRNIPGIVGGAILGDGRVALIIDVQDLAEKNLKVMSKEAS